MTPLDVALIAQYLEPELPALMGNEAWSTLEPTFKSILSQLTQSPSQENASELIELLLVHPQIRKRLEVTLGWGNKHQEIFSELSNLAIRSKVDYSIIAQLDSFSQNESSRLVVLKGVGQPVESIKWQNYDFDFG